MEAWGWGIEDVEPYTSTFYFSYVEVELMGFSLHVPSHDLFLPLAIATMSLYLRTAQQRLSTANPGTGCEMSRNLSPGDHTLDRQSLNSPKFFPLNFVCVCACVFVSNVSIIISYMYIYIYKSIARATKFCLVVIYSKAGFL